MPDDQVSRIASLEAYSKTHRADIDELSADMRRIREGVESIQRDLHGARVGGRVALAIALAFGGFIAWIIQAVSR